MIEYIAKIRVGSKIEEIVVLSENIEGAKASAGRQGRLVSIRKNSGLSTLFSRGMSSAERIVFLSRLSTMVRSRLGMGESLKVMKSAFKGPIARVSNELYKRVESGADFGDALVSMRRDFPENVSALIRSGMKSGDIATALEDAAAFEAEMDAVRRDSSQGVMAAVFHFLMSAGVIIGTSVFLGPYVMESDLIKAAGSSVDVDWIFTTADVIGVMMGLITLLFIGLLVLAFIVKPLAPAFADRVILKIPVYRDLVLAQKNYTVFYGMGLLVKAGVRMEETLKLCYESAPAGEVAEDLKRAYGAVKKGESWPLAMRNLHPTDRAALGVSQDREQIAISLSSVAQQYKKTYAQRVQQVVPIMKTIAALFMTIGGALIFGMIILPMLQMTQGILQ